MAYGLTIRYRMAVTRGDGRLSAADWARAALRALETGGLRAVAVEPLARELGTTKGSFYWHFKNRDALIEAALRRWEEIGTDAFIAAVREQPDPARRVRELFAAAIERGTTGRVELALLAAIDHPVIAEALARIAERRVGYIAEQLTELGVEPARARQRAVIAVSVYHGFNQLVHTAPGSLPDAVARRALVDAAVDSLLAGTEAS